MNRQNFNIADWLPGVENTNELFNAQEKTMENEKTEITEQNTTTDIELVTARIESAKVDITSDYKNWLKIGFALVSSLGEAGRNYYHRVSRFYPNYTYPECDLQYNKCLNTNNIRTSISTFFYIAQEAGIDIECTDGPVSANATEKKQTIIEKPNLPVAEATEKVEESGAVLFDTPKLPKEIYTNLPAILQDSCDLFEDGIEKDVFLIASLAVISGCLPNIQGKYFEEIYSSHLYAFITAPAGSGKGKMKWAKYFGQTIHDELLEHSRKERLAYESELEQYENLTKPQKQVVEKPTEPKREMFYVPANSSSSAFIQVLNDNNYRGVIFETEADSLAVTFKQDWGNFSDVLRKAFHHESTSMIRRKENEFNDIKDPHLSIILSGTPKQVQHIMPEAEDGLLSRFTFYAFYDNSEFKNPFISHQQVNYPEFFKRKGLEVFELYQYLQKLTNPITFKLTEEQGRRFTESFKIMLTKSKLLLGDDLNASVKRLGLISFRMAMILTVLRITEQVATLSIDDEVPLESNSNGNNLLFKYLLRSPLICSDQDYETAITIVSILEKHAVAVYQNMPNNTLKGVKLKFYDKLPHQFNRQGYLKVAEELGINAKTAEKYIGLFKPKLLNHLHNDYTKLTK